MSVPSKQSRAAAKAARDRMLDASSRSRVVKTVSLQSGGYVILKRICGENGWTVSETLDELIAAFISVYESDR